MLWICLGIYCLILAVDGQRRPVIIEEEVLDDIMNKYNKLARPATSGNHTVIVKHGFHLIKVLDCDGTTLKAETWLPVSWNDPRLVWSLDVYNIKSLTVPSDIVWKPDIVLFNNPSSHAGNAYNPSVIITYSGEVSWFPATTITTTCENSNFDSSTVHCLMVFGSWSYDGTKIDLEKMYSSVDMDDYVENNIWEYVNSSIVKNVERYPLWPEPYIDINYNITLRKRDTSFSESINEMNAGAGKQNETMTITDNGGSRTRGAGSKTHVETEGSENETKDKVESMAGEK